MNYSTVIYNNTTNGTENGTYDFVGTTTGGGNGTNGTFDYESCYFYVASQITSFFIGNKFILV